MTLQASNALAVYDKIDNPLAFADRMAQPACAMMGCSVQQGPAVAMAMLCSGLDPMQFARRFHWIEGKPTMKASAMLAEFRMNHGGQYKVIKREPDKCEIHFTDSNGETYESELTWEEAQRAPWPYAIWDYEKNQPASEQLKHNWATPLQRRSMLFARCVSDSLGFICPELTAGVYTPEEMSDVREELDDLPVKPATSIVDAKVTTSAANGQHQAEREEKPVESSDPGSAERQTLDAIRDLFEELEVPHDQQVAALESRKCNTLRNLSEDQARVILARLQDRKRQLAAAGNE